MTEKAHPSRAPSLETIGMSKSFGAPKALQDVSIKVSAGSFHALLGENGAGKRSSNASWGSIPWTAGNSCLTARRSRFTTPRRAGARNRHGDIRSQIMEQRNRGVAVLLMSEDLDEILELSDRIAAMSGGKVAYVADAATADRAMIGRHMAGH